ncbi:MAG: CapA family protein [Leptospiraceae bacterium]|nr:CapA family protein [Leptospiraceae bacterium]
MERLSRAGLWPALLLFTLSLTSASCGSSDERKNQEPVPVAPSALGIADTDITLLFAGDTNFIWGVEDLQRQRGMLYPLEEVMQMLESADFTSVNLETAITTRGTPINEKNYVFNSSPLLARVLADVGVDMLILGNNHSMDMGDEGLKDTIRFARQHGFFTPGAGTNLQQASMPAIVRIKGLTIGFFSGNEIGPDTNFANGNRSGTAGLSIVQSSLRNWCPRLDMCIVNLHWGMEYSPHPGAHQRSVAENLIRAGADAIIGHHPHIPQGVEIIDGKPVFYSVGNFLFGSVNFKQNHNLVVRLVIDPEKKAVKRAEVYAVHGIYRENGHRIRLLAGAEAMTVWEEIYVQSRLLGSKSNIAFSQDLRSMVVFPQAIKRESE